MDPDTKGESNDKKSVKELEDEVSSLKQQMKELQEQLSTVLDQSENDQKVVHNLEVKIDDLTGQLKEKNKEVLELMDKLRKKDKEVLELQSSKDQLTEEVQDYEDKIKQLKGDLKEINESVRSLRAEVNKLDCRVAKYEHDRDKLYLCQVAVEFERAMCSHVIPEVFSTGKGTASANIGSLLNMLNSGDEGYVPLDPAKHDIKAILGRAQPRWEKICHDLKLPQKWKKITGKEIDFTHSSVPPMFRAIALLKRERNPVAHPNPVSVREAQEKVKTTSIRKDLEYWEFALVEGFISSLPTYLKTIGIQADKSRLIV